MKIFNNIIVIFPQDPTIDFLQPIVDLVTSLLPTATVYRPISGELLDPITDDTELVIFLGHGTSRNLLGGVDKEGNKSILFNTQNGAYKFDGCALILFSCNSKEYLKNIRANPISIENYIVFGDMPTDKEHIEHNQKELKNYWPDFEITHLEYYRNFLIEAVSNGFKKAIQTNSFQGFYKGINHVVNFKINEIIQNENWTKNQKLQIIERVIEFKSDISYENSL